MIDVRDVRSKMTVRGLFVVIVDLTNILLIIRQKQLLGQQPRPRAVQDQAIVLLDVVQASPGLLNLGRHLHVLLDDLSGSVRSLDGKHFVLLVGAAAAAVVERTDDAVRQDVVGVLVLLEEGCHLVLDGHEFKNRNTGKLWGNFNAQGVVMLVGLHEEQASTRIFLHMLLDKFSARTILCYFTMLRYQKLY